MKETYSNEYFSACYLTELVSFLSDLYLGKKLVNKIKFWTVCSQKKNLQK